MQVKLITSANTNMTSQKRKRFHKPLRLLLAQAETGNAAAQFELYEHPLLGKEERFYWLVKASQQGLAVACNEFERVQLAREVAALCEKLFHGYVDAAYQLGVHPKLEPPVQYGWLCHVARLGHKLAMDAVSRIDLLISSNENTAVLTATVGKMKSNLH